MQSLCRSAEPEKPQTARTRSSSRFDPRIVVSVTGCFGGYEFFRAIETADRLGFQSVALMPGPAATNSLGELPTLNWHVADDAKRRRVKERLRRFKHISIHQAWNNEWHQWLDCAADIGAEIVTIHDGTPARGGDAKQFIAKRVAYFRQVGDYAQQRRVKIGIENDDGPMERYIELVKTVAHPAVGATIDVGHCAFFDEVKAVADMNQRAAKVNDTLNHVVRELGPLIRLFHVHNIKRYEDMDFTGFASSRWRPGSLVDHRIVTEGIVDFRRLFGTLKAINYRGPLELELEEPEREQALVASARRLSNLLAEFLPAAK
jgi:sugar phosphate isomerase/epimerase